MSLIALTSLVLLALIEARARRVPVKVAATARGSRRS
jgi:hypothetical protein